MRKISFVLIATCLIMFSCCSTKNSKTNSENTGNLTEKLEGYWISTNKDYEKTEKGTALFYGKIDKNMTGVYLQSEKEMQYRILRVNEAKNQIEIAIKYTSSRERTETLIFSNNYNRILNKIVTPDGIAIDSYYIRNYTKTKHDEK